MANRSTMDFFERQDDARKNTGRLILLFGLAIAVLTGGTYLALAMILNPDVLVYLFEPQDAGRLDLELGLLSLVVTGAVIFAGSAYKISSLNNGGSVVAETMGGKEIDSSTMDPLERRFVNVVEEMALASGVPVPRIYVLERENGINAFAAGYTMNDAAVAVTRGALEQLTRDELQAVVAHEFSHILNGDMRLNIRLIGVIHGILIIYLTGRVFMRAAARGSRSSRRGGGGGGIILAGVVLWVFGLGGVFCGRLIKSAVSRQREYLADAAAVQFTRNPQALAGALKKIGGYTYGSSLGAANAEEISHMCFGSVRGGGLSGFSSGLMSTHPPLEKRIRAVDPSFDGTYRVIEAGEKHAALGADEVAAVAGSSTGGNRAEGGVFDLGDGSMAQGMAMAAAMSTGGNDWSSQGRELDYQVAPDDVLESVGETSPQNLIYCSTLLDEIPRPLMEVRSDLMGSMAAVYTLLLDHDAQERQKQAAMLKRHADPRILKEARRLWPSVATLDDEFRLPFMDLLVPSLRRMTDDQFKEFSAMVDRLIQADGKVTFKEFVLERVLLHRLEVARFRANRKAVQFHSFGAVGSDISNLLSCLAYVGHDDMAMARYSFDEGVKRLPKRVQGRIEFRDRSRWTFPNVAASLERLSVASPTIKKKVIDACAYCVMGDGVVVVEEVEMLRATCESLDVPLPPFIPEATRRVA